MHVHLFRLTAHSRNWYAQVYLGGKRHRFTCKTTDKRTARQYAQRKLELLRERYHRGLVGLPEPVRLSEVFDRYERDELPKLRPASQRRSAGIVAQTRTWFVSGPLNDPLVTAVQPADIAAFLERKRGEDVSPRTVNLYRSILHRVFRLCVRPWMLIPSNPVAATDTLREEPREPRIIDDEQYRRLLAATADPMAKLFITLAWETGARSSELLQLEWPDVHLGRGLVTFANDPSRGRQTKGRRSRTVPLSADALSALRDHAARFRLPAPVTVSVQAPATQARRGARSTDRANLSRFQGSGKTRPTHRPAAP
jgi:integrase